MFFMVLAILITTFLDSTFLPSSKQLSRQHVPSIIQTTVPAVHDLSSLLCLLTGDGDSNPRDIKVRARGEGLWRISDAHYAYDPLHFVLFHPHGKPNWHPNITGATPAVVDGLSSEDEQ
jgi:hypothetical protein